MLEQLGCTKLSLASSTGFRSAANCSLLKVMKRSFPLQNRALDHVQEQWQRVFIEHPGQWGKRRGKQFLVPSVSPHPTYIMGAGLFLLWKRLPGVVGTPFCLPHSPACPPTSRSSDWCGNSLPGSCGQAVEAQFPLPQKRLCVEKVLGGNFSTPCSQCLGHIAPLPPPYLCYCFREVICIIYHAAHFFPGEVIHYFPQYSLKPSKKYIMA